jgi:hypothetical protein
MTTDRKYWLGQVPKSCEICGKPIKKVFYDARTRRGPWALMCEKCFTTGPGTGKLGIGLGQEYAQDGEHWVKIS